MTIRIEIETGNDAMKTAGDVGRALSALGHKLVTGQAKMKDGNEGKIMDENGLRVGKWAVTRG